MILRIAFVPPTYARSCTGLLALILLPDRGGLGPETALSCGTWNLVIFLLLTRWLGRTGGSLRSLLTVSEEWGETGWNKFLAVAMSAARRASVRTAARGPAGATATRATA